MSTGLLGKKIGMTSVFSSEGQMIPVTVLQVGPCMVTQVKTEVKDGYRSVQLGFDEIPVKKLNRPISGHLKKSSDKGYRVLREFRTQADDQFEIGHSLSVEMFSVGEKVNISGISKGRGFQGTVKRHGFHRGPESHGSRNHRAPGSIGNSAWPAKVIKGKKMPGHMGTDKVTVKNMIIVDIKPDENILLVKGAVPGFKTGVLEIIKAG